MDLNESIEHARERGTEEYKASAAELQKFALYAAGVIVFIITLVWVWGAVVSPLIEAWQTTVPVEIQAPITEEERSVSILVRAGVGIFLLLLIAGAVIGYSILTTSSTSSMSRARAAGRVAGPIFMRVFGIAAFAVIIGVGFDYIEDDIAPWAVEELHLPVWGAFIFGWILILMIGSAFLHALKLNGSVVSHLFSIALLLVFVYYAGPSLADWVRDERATWKAEETLEEERRASERRIQEAQRCSDESPRILNEARGRETIRGCEVVRIAPPWELEDIFIHTTGCVLFTPYLNGRATRSPQRWCGERVDLPSDQPFNYQFKALESPATISWRRA